MKNGFEIKLNLETQISPKGRPFRLSGCKNITDGRWINKELKYCWEYSFLFLDVEISEFLIVQINEYNEVTFVK